MYILVQYKLWHLEVVAETSAVQAKVPGMQFNHRFPASTFQGCPMHCGDGKEMSAIIATSYSRAPIVLPTPPPTFFCVQDVNSFLGLLAWVLQAEGSWRYAVILLRLSHQATIPSCTTSCFSCLPYRDHEAKWLSYRFLSTASTSDQVMLGLPFSLSLPVITRVST